MNLKFLENSKNQRTKELKRNIVAGFGIKGISVITQLLLVPLTVNYISSELYGIWLTLSSIIQWISFFDIGFGNGLRNKLGEALALGHIKRAKIYVSTTYVIMTAIFSLLCMILYILIPYIDWTNLLNISFHYQGTISVVMRILLIAFCIQIVLKLVGNVVQAYQHYALSSLFDALGNLLVLLFIYILSITLAPELKNIAIIFSFAPVVVYLLATLILYGGKFKAICPNPKYCKMTFAKDILNLGGKFFLIQIATIILFQMINILISRFCGSEQVAVYNISYKYLSVLLMVQMIIISPLWSAFTDAYIKKDVLWMSSIYKKLIRLCCVMILGLLVIVFISPVVYRYWIGDSIQVPLSLSALIGLYVLMLIWGQTHSILLNGMGKVKFQFYYSFMAMIGFLPLAYCFGSKWHLNGIVMALIIINIPSMIAGPYQVVHLIRGTAKGFWNK